MKKKEVNRIISFVCKDCKNEYITDQKEICPFCESENLDVYQTVNYFNCKCGRQIFFTTKK